MNVAASALLAALAMSAAGAASAQTAESAATVDENGVHAVPTEPVDVEPLAPVGKAEAGKSEAARPDPARLANARVAPPTRLTLQLVAEPDETAAAPSEDPAPAPETFSEEAAVMGRPAAAPVAPPVRSATELASAGDLTRAAAAADAGEPAGLSKADRRAAEPQLSQHVAFPRRSAEAAGAFSRYMHDAAAIDPKFQSAAGVAEGLKVGAGYDAGQLQEGMVAYGAMAALQSARFVYAVMDAAADARSRHDLKEQLLADPVGAVRLRGAEEAAALANAAILHEVAPVVANGKALKQAAYDVQHQAWSGAAAPDQAGRLARAKAESAIRATVKDSDMAELMSGLASVTAERGGGSPFTPAAVRSVALAALAILGDGDADADEAPRMQAVSADLSTAQCLKMAKLNLFQCLSVAGPEYEDVYCLGQHAVFDTGQCVSAAAKPVSPLLQAALPRDPRPVMVPVSTISRVPSGD